MFWMEQFLGTENEADQQTLQQISITVADEAKYGGRAAKTFLNELGRRRVQVVHRGPDVEYLKKLVAIVRPHMKNHARYPTIRVYLAEAPFPEAKCFPGGTLVFFRGLLQQAGSEAALVGVTGHELSHLDHGHQLHLLRRMKLAQQTFAGRTPTTAQQFFQSGTLLMRAFLRPFRPEEETVADRDGATWAYAAGYDPRQLAALFLTLNKRKTGFQNNLPEFLRTHPYPLHRHKYVMDLVDELQFASPNPSLYIGRENLHQRIPRSEREFTEER